MDNIPYTQVQSTHSQRTEPFIFNEHLNTIFLAKTYGNNLSFGAKMFGVFLKTIHQDLDILQNSGAQKDFETLRGIAHKIKNNFTWVGLPELSNLTYKVEKLATEESEAVVPLVKEILFKSRNVFPYVEMQLDELLAVAV